MSDAELNDNWRPTARDGLLMRGAVKRAVTINAVPDAVYDYLADTETLLTKVPYVERIQLRRKTGKARAFFRMMVLGYDLVAVIDAEPTYDLPNRIIRLAPPSSPFGVVAFDTMLGFFRCAIKVVQTVDNPRASRVTANISLALDVSSNDLLSYFPRPFLEGAGAALFQQQIENLCEEYTARLIEDFPPFYTEWKRAKAGRTTGQPS